MIYEPTRKKAQAFLERETMAHLVALGALLFEPVDVVYGVQHEGQLVAISVVVAGEANLPDSIPTITVSGRDAKGLAALVGGANYPPRATWVACTPMARGVLEQQLGRMPEPEQGMVYFLATKAPEQHRAARELTSADTALDLSPCSLSAMALGYWLLRGWRVFGLVENGRLLGHAVAAYPIANTEEVSAVFTAPEARRRGVASACAAATVANIQARGKQAVYVSRKANRASIRVAEGLGMQRLFETWEFVMP